MKYTITLIYFQMKIEIIIKMMMRRKSKYNLNMMTPGIMRCNPIKAPIHLKPIVRIKLPPL